MRVSIIEFLIKRLGTFNKNIIVSTILTEGVQKDPLATKTFLKSCIKAIDEKWYI